MNELNLVVEKGSFEKSNSSNNTFLKIEVSDENLVEALINLPEWKRTWLVGELKGGNSAT